VPFLRKRFLVFYFQHFHLFSDLPTKVVL